MKNFLTTLSLSLLTASTAIVSAFAEDPVAPAGSAPATGAAAKQPGMLEMIMPFGVMFLIMYFLMIRPQQKRAKEQANLLNDLKAGDEVLTTSGFLGKVEGVSEKIVTLELDRNIKVRMLKSQIAQKMSADSLNAQPKA